MKKRDIELMHPTRQFLRASMISTFYTVVLWLVINSVVQVEGRMFILEIITSIFCYLLTTATVTRRAIKKAQRLPYQFFDEDQSLKKEKSFSTADALYKEKTISIYERARMFQYIHGLIKSQNTIIMFKEKTVERSLAATGS